MSELEAVKTIAELATPLTSAVIEKWLSPKLAALFANRRRKSALVAEAFASSFDHYMRQAFARHSYLSVLVLQNQRRRLEDLYIPLTLRSREQDVTHTINDYDPALFRDLKRVLITDTAGMGKSTLMKFLFLRCIEKNAGIPVFIELRRLKGDLDLVALLQQEIGPLAGELDRQFLLDLIARGDFVFFLDGYDEIPFTERDSATRELQNFIAKADENIFVITSRPETALAIFADVHAFTIAPLERDEAFALLRKYDRKGTVSGSLISRLEQPQTEGVDEFLTNPLLVSLLYKSFDHKQNIPLKRHLFYRQVYDALFESHDLSKGDSFIREKYSGLDIDAFERVLRHLAFTTAKAGTLEYTKDEILHLLERVKDQCTGSVYSATSYLRDLISTVPLFSVDGDLYRWSHKSLQEYFAAKFVIQDAREHQQTLLARMAGEREVIRFINILELAYDMDPPAFERAVLIPLVLEFLQHYDHTLENVSNVDSRDLEFRKRHSFLRFPVIVSAENLDRVYSGDLFDDSGTGINEKQQRMIWNSWDLGKTGLAFSELVSGRHLLLTILKRRGNGLVGSRLRRGPNLRDAEALGSALRESGTTIDPYLRLTNEDPEAVVNRPEIFHLVTGHLRSNCDAVLKVVECRRFLKRVEVAAKNRTEENFLFSGL